MRSSQTDHQYWLFRFLRWFCPDHLYEEIEGDLFQKFEKDINYLAGLSSTTKLRRIDSRILLDFDEVADL